MKSPSEDTFPLRRWRWFCALGPVCSIIALAGATFSGLLQKATDALPFNIPAGAEILIPVGWFVFALCCSVWSAVDIYRTRKIGEENSVPFLVFGTIAIFVGHFVALVLVLLAGILVLSNFGNSGR